ncbi:MAG: carbohydrate ABC transporter permease [bacterium]
MEAKGISEIFAMRGRIPRGRIRLKLSILIVHAILILGGISMVLPFLWMISTAFKPEWENIAYPPYWIPKSPTLDNFIEAFGRAPFHIFFLNTVIVSTAVTVFALFFCSLGGYVFAKLRFPGKNIFFLLVLGKIMVPFQVTVVPLYLIVVKLGMGDSLLALITPLVVSAFGIFMMRQFILTIPDDLIDAAKIDGCSDFGVYLRIILPSITPALATLAIFLFMDTWGQFLWPLIVIKSPEKMTLQLGLAMFSNQYFTEYGPLMAGTLISVMPVLIVFAFLQRRVIESITMTGLKG